MCIMKEEKLIIQLLSSTSIKMTSWCCHNDDTGKMNGKFDEISFNLTITDESNELKYLSLTPKVMSLLLQINNIKTVKRIF